MEINGNKLMEIRNERFCLRILEIKILLILLSKF